MYIDMKSMDNYCISVHDEINVMASVKVKLLLSQTMFEALQWYQNSD